MFFAILQLLFVASFIFQSNVSALKLPLSNNNGNITSPNYPLNYGDGVDNRYHIQAPIGHVISFKFHFFELEDKDKNGNDTDVLKIIDGRKSQNRVRINISGNLTTPFYITSKTDYVRIIFVSNRNNVTFKGFHITYQVYKKEVLCKNEAAFKSCQIPNVPSNQCIEDCVGNLTLIPYNYSTSCNEGVFAPFACVDTKEIERCVADATYTKCAYTVNEMIKIFETLEIVEEINSTEGKEEDNDDFFDLGWSISPECLNYCKRNPNNSELFTKPNRCYQLQKRRWWTRKRFIKEMKQCVQCRSNGCKPPHIRK